jgi:hypothetical protein
VRAAPARQPRDARLDGMQRGMTICESELEYRTRGGSRRGEESVASEERSSSTQEELCARDHVVASVVSLFSARHNVGAYVLSLLAISMLSSRLRRSHDAFSQVCGSPQPCVPRPLPAPASTGPARARAARAGARTAEIQVGPGDTGSAFARICTRAASSESPSSSCVPPIRREQGQRTDRFSLSLFPPQHSWHEAMVERYLCPHQYPSCVSSPKPMMRGVANLRWGEIQPSEATVSLRMTV